MERELWPLLYAELQACGKDFTQKYVQMPPWIIVACLLWAILHDRPVCWACDKRNWATTRLRPEQLPSAATMSRRGYSIVVGFIWRALEDRLRQYTDHPALVSFLDGKPLPVGGYSKDPDAGFGRGAGMNDRGYKLHTIWSNRAMPEQWEIASIRESEKTVATELLEQPQRQGSGGYLLGDGNYDSSKLFDQAHKAGYQLVTPMPDANAGKGHCYQSPHRLRCIEMMKPGMGMSDFGPTIYKQRHAIERCFGNATSFGGGMGPLPAWARRLKRVRFWVWGKLLINAVRILRLQRLTPSLQ